jgi:Phosphopantetheine attachment site
LRRHLRRSLPEFMVPSMILPVEEIPQTPNGKTDRAALPNPYTAAMSAPHEFVAPSTDTEHLIAAVWCRLLGVERVGATDRFFDLGGHSLLAMQATAEISAATGVRLEPRLLFFRTLADLAAACDTVSAPANVGNAS